MSCAELTIELLAGTEFEDAVSEAKRLAVKLDLVYVKFKFNHVNVSVGQGCNVEGAVDEYMNDRKKFMIFNHWE